MRPENEAFAETCVGASVYNLQQWELSGCGLHTRYTISCETCYDGNFSMSDHTPQNLV